METPLSVNYSKRHHCRNQRDRAGARKQVRQIFLARFPERFPLSSLV